MSRPFGCRNKNCHVDFVGYDRKKALLSIKGFKIAEIYRHAIDNAIVEAYNNKQLNLDELSYYMVDLDNCIDSVNKYPKPK